MAVSPALHPRERRTDGRGFVRLDGLTAGTKRIEAEGAPQPLEVRIPRLTIDPAEPDE